jgi:hypothetical protein
MRAIHISDQQCPILQLVKIQSEVFLQYVLPLQIIFRLLYSSELVNKAPKSL